MTFVAPPLPVDPSIAAQTIARGPMPMPQPQPQPVAVVELPQAVAALERAVLLPGTVIDQQTSAQGILAQVRTSLGDILLQLATPTQVGGQVTLQIPPGTPDNPPTTAVLTPQMGGAAQNQATQVPPTAAANTPAVVANIGTPAAPLQPGALLEVLQLPTLLASSAATASSVTPSVNANGAPTLPGQTTTSPQGTTIAGNGTTAATAPTADATQPATANPQATTAAAAPALRGAGAALFAQTVATEGAVPTLGATGTTTLTPSQTPAPIAARVLDVLPPGVKPPLAGPDQLVATVGTARAGGFPVATTADGQAIALQTNASVDPGSTVVLQRLPTPVGASGDVPLAPLDPIRGGDWPALAAALRTLEVADPAAAAQLRAGIPQPSTNLAPAMMFVAAALKLGDPRSLFGAPAIDALKRAGKGSVAERLDADFDAASTRAADMAGAEWRSYPIPMREPDGNVAMMQLHVLRRDDTQRQVGDREANSKDEGEGKRTRFLLDIAPSALGPIQLDGLVRPSQVSPVVDMVVRSKTPLPDEMRRDIAGIWADALSLTGAKGALVFQANPQSFVDTTNFRPLHQGKGLGLSA